MKNKKISIPVFLLIGTALLYLWVYPQISKAKDSTEYVSSHNKVRQLLLAIECYKRDRKVPPFYPATLEELVSEKYIDKEEFAKLISDLQMNYFPPDLGLPSKNHLVIVAHSKNYIIFGFASLDIVLERLKQH
jgi:replicative superfamily II helicase